MQILLITLITSVFFTLTYEVSLTKVSDKETIKAIVCEKLCGGI